MKLTEAEMRMVFQIESTNQDAALNEISMCTRLTQQLNPKSKTFFRRIILWNFSTAQLVFCRLSLWLSVFGAQSTCWRATATITPVPMLMYGKEASNRKQEIDRQHHTIPNQRKQRPQCRLLRNPSHTYLQKHDKDSIP